MDRLGEELTGKRDQVETLLALGATRWEAAAFLSRCNFCFATALSNWPCNLATRFSHWLTSLAWAIPNCALALEIACSCSVIGDCLADVFLRDFLATLPVDFFEVFLVVFRTTALRFFKVFVTAFFAPFLLVFFVTRFLFTIFNCPATIRLCDT